MTDCTCSLGLLGIQLDRRRTLRRLGMLWYATVSLFISVLTYPAAAQQPSTGTTINIPESSVEHPGDLGVRGHTNIEIVVPRGGMPKQEPKSRNAKASQPCKKKLKPQLKSKKGG